MPIGGDAVAALRKLVESGHHFVLVDAPAETLLRLADSVKDKDVLLFNVRAPEVSLRQEECRANVLHTAPDRSMLADALAQYLVWKKWQRWLVVKGVFPEDLAYLDALRRAAQRFGATIVEEREYKETPGARRSDTGQQQIQLQMPVFTQGAPSHDVVVVADERGSVRPLSALPHLGSAAGRRHRRPQGHELASGARAMGRHADAEPLPALCQALHVPLDYQAWVAVRAIGEGGVTHAVFGEFAPINDASPQRPARACRLQGAESHVPHMGRAAPPADHRRRPRTAGLDVAATGFPARICRSRYARHRSAGEQVQTRKGRRNDREQVAYRRRGVARHDRSPPGRLRAYTVYVSNEKGNSLTVIDSATLQVQETVPVGQRPRGIMLTKDGKQLLICASDDDTVQMLDVATRRARRAICPLDRTPSCSTFIPREARSISPTRTTICSR